MNDLEAQLKVHHTAHLAFHAGAARDHQDECDKAEHDCEGKCFHAKRAAAHSEMGEYHADCLKTLSDGLGKAFASRGSEWQPLPDGLSVIAPDAPPSSLRPVFRVGQRTFGEPTPQVDEQFRKITEVD
jgi:hypothetical protein